jgi:hypothetical protein
LFNVNVNVNGNFNIKFNGNINVNINVNINGNISNCFSLFGYGLKSLCLFASNINMAAATETFIESMAPCMGILIF